MQETSLPPQSDEDADWEYIADMEDDLQEIFKLYSEVFDLCGRGNTAIEGAKFILSAGNNPKLKGSVHASLDRGQEKGPALAQRPSDGRFVKLVCLDCGCRDYGGAANFMNHCFIMHGRQFQSLDEAIERCGVKDEETEKSQRKTTARPTEVDAQLVKQAAQDNLGIVHRERCALLQIPRNNELGSLRKLSGKEHTFKLMKFLVALTKAGEQASNSASGTDQP